jgi:hypothetical protein
MGWKLLGVKLDFSDLGGSELFGTNVIATYRLGYTKSSGGKFTEMPRLDWHETIMMNDHGKGETWVFDTNMYTLNPLSRTLEVWPQRYLVAYDLARGGAGAAKGYSKLLTKSGAAVKVKDLEKAPTPQGQADAVRKYLASKGGILEIQIHDIPSIRVPKAGERKERLLLFNLGLVGGGSKVKAFQYLDLDGDKPRSEWVREHGAGWGVSGLKTTGLNKVAPPANVAQKEGATFAAGECW